jgi:5-formyltetrahydrofolate cyclo-ligase
MTATPPDIAARKAALRAEVLARRDALDAGERREASARVMAAVMTMEAFGRAQRVMAYASFGSELDTSALCRAVLDQGKVLALPRVDRARDGLRVYAVRDLDRDLQANRWGIREPRPDACEELPPGSLDFILVPGVAFDAEGGRLGYGKAYYDRLLAGCMRPGGRDAGAAGTSPALVAGGFTVQVVDEVPVVPHDLRIPVIVTERGFLRGQA